MRHDRSTLLDQASSHDRIAPTAHYTAYVWRRLRMPYSELYATRTGALLFWALRISAEWMIVLAGPGRIPTMPQYLAQRHRVIDHLLAGLDADRVVELGAGLSRRGTTWAADRDTPYIEMDLPAMIRRKRALIERRAPEGLRRALERNLRQIPADLTDPRFGEVLAESLRGSARPAVVAEGLLDYFGLPERRAILTAVRAALAAQGGGSFLFDLHVPARTARLRVAVAILRTLIRAVTRGHRVQEPFVDPSAAERYFRDLGFDRVARFEPLDLVRQIPALPKVYAPTELYLLAVTP